MAQKNRKIGMSSSDTGLIHVDEIRVSQRNRSEAQLRQCIDRDRTHWGKVIRKHKIALE